MSWESKTVCLLVAIFVAVIAIAQSAPAPSQTENDLVEILQLIRELGDTAARLENTLTEQENVEQEQVEEKEETKAETELEQVKENDIDEKSNLQGRSRCQASWCRMRRPPITDNSKEENVPETRNENDSERIDQLLQALTMLKKMKTQEQKRDYDIPFP